MSVAARVEHERARRLASSNDKEAIRLSMQMTVLVLTPHLGQQGGVTNYFRTLMLDSVPGIRYFFVNRLETRTALEKIVHLVAIYVHFILVAGRYRLVHVNPSLNAKSYYRDMGFIVLAKLFRRKVLVFFRGWDDAFERKIKSSAWSSALFRKTYGIADRYVVLSRTFREKLIGMGVKDSTPFHVETTVADSGGIETVDIDNKVRSIHSEVNFLFMSRVLKEKGIYVAMDAFAACQGRLTDVTLRFFVAGEGDDLAEVKSYVKEKGYSGVEFVGHVSGEAKSRLLEKSHIMLFPTFYGEGLPNCVLEAMLFGLPVVSRINAAIPDVVEHGVNGLLTESVESETFAEMCCTLIQDETLFRRMATANRTKATGWFTAEKVRARLVDIYAATAGES